jgi:molecular chaperone GrpE (heat shock protein)
MTRWLLAAGLTLGLLGGCNNIFPAKETRKTVRSMKETYEYLGKAAEELQATNSALDRLATTPDLAGWYKEYTGSVKKLQAAAADARERWLHMKDNSESYIARWDAEVAEAKTPQVQETMEQRRARVSASFQKVTDIAVEVRDSYQPYVQGLQDIEKALKMDLTAGGVKALEPTIAKTKADGAVVLQKLDALGIELDKLTGRMAPKQ